MTDWGEPDGGLTVSGPELLGAPEVVVVVVTPVVPVAGVEEVGVGDVGVEEAGVEEVGGAAPAAPVLVVLEL